MNFFKDVLPLLFSLAAIAVVLYLSYRFSKYLGNRVNQSANSANVRVLERVALGQDKGIAIVEICGKYHLLGFSNNGVTLLKELTDYQVPKSPSNPQDFLNVLKQAMNTKSSSAGKEKDELDGNK